MVLGSANLRGRDRNQIAVDLLGPDEAAAFDGPAVSGTENPVARPVPPYLS
jgi:hypothetical protein